jgi:hypothetical protein
MIRLSTKFAGIGGAILASAAHAQAPASPDETIVADAADAGEEIVVTGRRLEGAVIGDIAPEVTLSAGDIRSFGVSSLTDLIAELAPQTGSTQGRGGEAPVVLLNGRRISSFAEVRDIPTEAIQRVEILPEEVALKYGYRPNQKVVNVVLRRRFNAITAELEGGGPTAGGQFSPEAELSHLRIGDGGRLNLGVEYERSSALYESERNLVTETSGRPYDPRGNITAVDGGEIDPALSALLGGRPATVIGVPPSAAAGRPTLADFAGGTVNATDVGRYRTLLPKTESLAINGVFARQIFDGVSATINATLDYDRSRNAQGLAETRTSLPAASPFSPFAGDTLLYRSLDEFGALGQTNRDVTGHLGTSFSGALGGWQWSLTGTYDRIDSRTTTARGFDITGFQDRIAGLDPLANPFAQLTGNDVTGALFDRARSRSNVGGADLVLTGTLLTLPAGEASTTIKIGGATRDFTSRALRSGTETRASLARDDANAQISLDLPLASVKRGFLGLLGELSANVNLGYDRLSDFGMLRTFGAGLTWTPVRPLNLIVSISKDEGAPTVQQLGNPLVTSTGVRVFDYVRGETVDIARVTGGNPNLSADDRRVFKAGMTLKPFPANDLSLTATYTNSRVRDPIAAFPAATAALEAAFPDRFTRAADGELLRIDSRPINFARQDQEDLRWGLNLSKRLGPPPRSAPGARDGGPNLRDLLPPGRENDRPRQDQGGARDGASGRGPGGQGGGPGGGFGRGGGRGTRIQLAAYHTVHLRERILVFEGGPVLDLLQGDAIGSSGGQPRHEVQAQAGITHNGFGTRLSANWQSGTRVDGGVAGTQALRFSSLSTLNLRLFANLAQQEALARKWPFVRGMRVSLSVNNLLDDRLRVRDAAGETPVSYQPDYLDPLGRSVRISVRKLLF